MEEEKNKTTPPQKTGGKRRRRRRKPAAGRPQAAMQHPGAESLQTGTVTQPEKLSAETETVQPIPEASAENPQTPQEPPVDTVTDAAETTAPAIETASAAEPAEAPEPPERAESAAEEKAAQAPSVSDNGETCSPEPDDTTAEKVEPPAAGKPAEGEPAGPVPPEETAAGKAAPEEQSVEDASGAQLPSGAEAVPPEAGPEETEQQTPPQESGEETAAPATDQPPAEETPDGETAEEAPSVTAEEKTADTESAAEEEPPEDDDEMPEPSPEEEKRISDMTRTVQLSIEQIMSQVNEEEPEPSEPENTEEAVSEESTEEDEAATLGDQVRSGLSGMAKWLLLVVFFVLVIACCGVAWLYRNATPDMLPQITVRFAGQTLEPTAYKWKVPVIGNIFKRTYADTLSSTPLELTETVEQSSPDFVVSPSDYRTELTVTDAEENVVFEGDVDTFTAFQFTANGTYTAELSVYSDATSVPGDTSVTGSETWRVSFTVGIRPSIYLSSNTAAQGSAVAVRVGDTLDGSEPTIQTDLPNTGFFKASSGWICYLPIAWNQAAGTQNVEVTAGGYTETLELKIQATSWEYKDYYRESQRVSPYIGQNDLPAEVQKLLTTSEKTIGWSNGGFVQPFLNTLDVKLAFGTTEYVGRSYQERSTNNGTGGRTFTNLVLDTTSGELLIAPAGGKVLLAKDLGGTFGYTLVIDHGAGVKSIFYNLQKISVKAGDSLKQGQTIATCGGTTVAEMRIGTVPIDPLRVWRGQCDALKYY